MPPRTYYGALRESLRRKPDVDPDLLVPETFAGRELPGHLAVCSEPNCGNVILKSSFPKGRCLSCWRGRGR